MIYGTGIDIIEIERIGKSLEKYSPYFEDKIFTPSEIAYCRAKTKPERHFAARFAVKEAVLKSLGTGMGSGIRWKDLEVINDSGSGKPLLQVNGRGQEIFNQLNLKQIHISISHEDCYAIAQAVAEL